MNVIIVDDERNAIENLRDKLNQIPSVTVTGAFTNPLEAFEYVKENPVDVAFLDIEMYEMTGIEMAKRLKGIQPKTNIVFVTGYPKYAVDAFDTDASDYLLKPAAVERIETALSRLRNPVLKAVSRIRVQTFGSFEIFADDKPISFSRAKSKELLAYLIDRQGAGVTKKELSAVLWDDDDYSRTRQSHMQTLVSEMMKSLKVVHADDIVIKSYNSLSVNAKKFDCDYYRYLSGDIRALNVYTGQYMMNYSWAEFTAANLDIIK